MQHDKTTLKDLSVFTNDVNHSVFAILDRTSTQAGREMLRKHIIAPPNSPGHLQDVQDVIRFWTKNTDKWPPIITNGTLVMLEKFFEAADHMSAPPSGLSTLFNNFFQKLLNKDEYFFTQFSLSHLSDFLKGCIELVGILDMPGVPSLLQKELETMREELAHRLTNEIVKTDKQTAFKDVAAITFKAKREMKSTVMRLINQYARLDAWLSLAKATVENNWVFPTLVPDSKLTYNAKSLSHPLVAHAVSYDVDFNAQSNFLLLTGANMSGKTTFMRALGVGALLAHIGVGVPAKAMNISFLKGIVTNMQVEDDILKGESYFFAEVKRMKQTAERLLEPEAHLVLMDELFKGTNVHDAYECTRAVVEGLLNRSHHIMILSTHLYEVAQHFKQTQGIQFAYFLTDMKDDGTYHFKYQLREGISNDRIGYRILQKEGVLALLNKHSQ